MFIPIFPQRILIFSKQMSSTGMSIIIIIGNIYIFKSQDKINLLKFTFEIKLKPPFRTNSRIPLTKYQNILNVIFSLLLKKQGRIM